MRFEQYDKAVKSEEDLKRLNIKFEKYIQQKEEELKEFNERAKERIKWIDECKATNNFVILGHTFKDRREKGILLIKRFPDGSQEDERYSYTKISELRVKLQELKEKYSSIDWSAFKEEI